MEKLLTVKQAAKLLGTTEQGLRKRIWNQEVPARKFGKRVVFVESELEQFIKNLPKIWEASEEKKDE